MLAVAWIVEGQGAGDGVTQRELTLDQVRPRRRRAVFEVGHEDVGAAVERVDHHLAIHGSRDLHTTTPQGLWHRGDAPVSRADRGRIVTKAEDFDAVVQPLLPRRPRREQGQPLLVEGGVHTPDNLQHRRRKRVGLLGVVGDDFGVCALRHEVPGR